DRPQPGQPLRLALPAKLTAAVVRLQKRLLGDVGGVELRLQARAQLKSGEEPQIVAVPLQGPVFRGGCLVHGSPRSSTAGGCVRPGGVPRRLVCSRPSGSPKKIIRTERGTDLWPVPLAWGKLPVCLLPPGKLEACPTNPRSLTRRTPTGPARTSRA